jgi:hypothetical protein
MGLTGRLKPFLEEKPDDAILRRYHVVPAGELKSLRMGGNFIITQAGLVDSDYDSRIGIGPNTVRSIESTVIR